MNSTEQDLRDALELERWKLSRAKELLAVLRVAFDRHCTAAQAIAVALDVERWAAAQMTEAMEVASGEC